MLLAIRTIKQLIKQNINYFTLFTFCTDIKFTITNLYLSAINNCKALYNI